jgi:hypothetical protein
MSNKRNPATKPGPTEPGSAATPEPAGEPGSAATPEPAGEPGSAATPKTPGQIKAALIAAHPDLAPELKTLTADQGLVFVAIVKRARKKRRIQLTGYLMAAATAIAGTVVAFVMYGSHAPGRFSGGEFLIPFALVGLILFVFGRWSKRQ